MRFRGRRDRAARYAAAVVDALTPELPDLADVDVACVVRAAVTAHTTAPGPAFEAILDPADGANWRLRAHPPERGRVRVACYHPTPDGGRHRTRDAAQPAAVRRAGRPMNLDPVEPGVLAARAGRGGRLRRAHRRAQVLGHGAAERGERLEFAENACGTTAHVVAPPAPVRPD